MRDAAAAQGMEIALDFAIQYSPDHPWLKDHPEWFNWRPDGSSVRRKSAKKIRRHRQRRFLRSRRVSRAVERAARHRLLLARRRRPHFPCRQSAHQTAAVLGMADRRKCVADMPT